jgi:hypothetical protein
MEDRAIQPGQQRGTCAFAVLAVFVLTLSLLSATVFANKEIHFRIEKGWAYIPITKSGSSAGEEKLRVMSAALKAESPANRPQAAPEKTKTRPPASQ